MSGKRSRDKEWRVISDAPNYEVSNDGEIRNIRFGKLLKPILCQNGRLHINLYLTTTTKKMFAIHRLVLKAFVGDPLPGQVCRHLNNIPTDNRIENICWGTQLENIHDQYRHDTRLFGRRHPNAKLTAEQVSYLRANAGRLNMTAKAREYGVDFNVIKWAMIGKHYPHG